MYTVSGAFYNINVPECIQVSDNGHSMHFMPPIKYKRHKMPWL